MPHQLKGKGHRLLFLLPRFPAVIECVPSIRKTKTDHPLHIHVPQYAYVGQSSGEMSEGGRELVLGFATCNSLHMSSVSVTKTNATMSSHTSVESETGDCHCIDDVHTQHLFRSSVRPSASSISRPAFDFPISSMRCRRKSVSQADTPHLTVSVPPLLRSVFTIRYPSAIDNDEVESICYYFSHSF